MVQKSQIVVPLGKVAEILSATIEPNGFSLDQAKHIPLSALSIPEDQREGSLCLIAQKEKLSLPCLASAYIIPNKLYSQIKADITFKAPILLVDDGKKAIVTLLNALYPKKEVKHKIGKAVLEKGVKIHKPVDISHFVVVGKHSIIGKNTTIGANVTIGENVIIGEGCTIYPNVTIYDNITIGNNVIIHSGARIGADGFGFLPPSKESPLPTKIPQKGTVQIMDYVEIGANTCIDRATIGATIIGTGTKLDDLVMVGHNTHLGKCCLIASQAGFSGSIEVGDFVVAGGQVGFADHIKVASGAMFGGQSGVPSDVEKPGAYLGAPCMPFKDFAKSHAIFKELPELKKKIKNIK